MVKTKAMFKKNNNETAKVKQNKPQNNSGTNNGIKKQKKDQSAVVAKNIKAKENLIKSQNNKLSNAKEIKEKQLETKNKIKKLLKNIPTQEQENSESDDDQEMASDDEEEEVNSSEDEEEEINDSEDEEEEMNNSDVAEEENDSEINVSNGKNEGKERLKKDAKRNNEDEGIIVPRSDEKNSDSNTISKVAYDQLYEYKLFIDNLPMDTTYADLFKLFSDCTSITKILLINRDSFEFGFKIADSLNGTVIFKSFDEVTKALQYNETEFKGRQIAVRMVKSRVSVHITRHRHNILFPPNVSIFMRNVNPGTNEEQIKQFFSSCGEVKDILFKEKRQACVKFTEPNAIPPALALNNTELNGSNVSIIVYKHFEKPKFQNFTIDRNRPQFQNFTIDRNRPKFQNFTPFANSREFEDKLIKKIEGKIMWKLQNKKEK